MRIAAILPLLLLTGCALGPSATPTLQQGASIRGNVHGGQQPIVGAHVYLFAANTTGYGNASVSTLSPSAPGAATDSVGTYVTTAADGGFSITGDYTCTSGTQLYIYTLGGNPGAGSNPAAGLLAILGQCPASGTFATTVPYIWINEVSTVAASYAMAGYATDATHVSTSGSPLAQTGIANAFANAANLASISTGSALATTPAGNGTIPRARINTLANILASCINSTGAITGPATPTTCYTLFNNSMSNGTTGTIPNDTAAAAINIAHYPALHISALYGLVSGHQAFAPGLASQPNDFVLGINFTGSGLYEPNSMAIDAEGDAWISNNFGNSVTELSSSGAVLSGSGGFTGGGLSQPGSIAIDESGNAWVTSASSGGSMVKFSSSGSILSGSTGYTAGSISTPKLVAIDSTGNAWVTCGGDAVVKLSGAGVPLSGSAGYKSSGFQRPNAIAIDGSGNAWVSTLSGTNTIFKLSNSGSFLSPAGGYPASEVADAPSIAIDSSGDVWAVGAQNNVTKISTSGASLLEVTEDGADSVAIDGAGNAWAASVANTVVSGVSNSGSAISGTLGYNGGVITSPVFVAVDGSGDIWVLNEAFGSPGTGVTELIGASTPVVTPIAAGVKNNALGTRP